MRGKAYGQGTISVVSPAASALSLGSLLTRCSTALGRIPHFSDTLFPPSSLGVIKTIADFALIFFMWVERLRRGSATDCSSSRSHIV
jgi:hypothetical protein